MRVQETRDSGKEGCGLDHDLVRYNGTQSCLMVAIVCENEDGDMGKM